MDSSLRKLKSLWESDSLLKSYGYIVISFDIVIYPIFVLLVFSGFGILTCIYGLFRS